jgi:hypothetical protein
MSSCSRCKKEYPECELIWIEIIPEDHMRIRWTGRGRAPGQEKKMELVCDDCKKEDTTFSSLSS